MSKAYTSTSAGVVILLFTGIFLFLVGGTVWSLWHGEVWLAFCRVWGAIIIFAITFFCHEAWKTK